MGSLEHGTGLTTLCLALSNFLCNKAGKKTAYIELNTSNEISSLSDFYKDDAFTHMGINFFPHKTFTSLAEILHMDFDYFVLDMGVLNSYSLKEFVKFEKTFLVCSLNRWKKEKTTKKLSMLLSTNCVQLTHTIILCNCGKKESTLRLSSNQIFSVLPIPFIENPFQLNPEFFSSFGRILGQY